jgi:hypothetical protein
MAHLQGTESEWLTRKERIDPKLDHAGWPLRLPADPGPGSAQRK